MNNVLGNDGFVQGKQEYIADTAFEAKADSQQWCDQFFTVGFRIFLRWTNALLWTPKYSQRWKTPDQLLWPNALPLTTDYREPPYRPTVNRSTVYRNTVNQPGKRQPTVNRPTVNQPTINWPSSTSTIYCSTNWLCLNPLATMPTILSHSSHASTPTATTILFKFFAHFSCPA